MKQWLRFDSLNTEPKERIQVHVISSVTALQQKLMKEKRIQGM